MTDLSEQAKKAWVDFWKKNMNLLIKKDSGEEISPELTNLNLNLIKERIEKE